MRRLESRYNLQLDADIRLLAQSAVNDAFKATKPSDKKMRENRHKEKHTVEKENYSIADRLENVPEVEEKKKEPVPEDTIKSLETVANETNVEEPNEMPEEEFDFDNFLKVAGRVNNG